MVPRGSSHYSSTRAFASWSISQCGYTSKAVSGVGEYRQRKGQIRLQFDSVDDFAWSDSAGSIMYQAPAFFVRAAVTPAFRGYEPYRIETMLVFKMLVLVNMCVYYVPFRALSYLMYL